jgi:hypothetical protein
MASVAEIAVLLTGRDELSSLLGDVKEVMNAVGEAGKELLGGLGDIGSEFGEVGGEALQFAGVLGAVATAATALGVAFVTDLLEGARSYGLELEHLNSLTGVNVDSLSG